MENPLEHFELTPLIPFHLFGIDLSINQAVIMMWIASGVVFSFFYLAGRRGQIIPTKLQGVAEISIDFLRNLIRDNAGEEALRFFPFLATLFFFVLFTNLLGLVPGSYTATSQVIVTGTLAIWVYFMSVVVGFSCHGLGYLRVLTPPGVPMWLLPAMIPIELVSHIARPFSLAIRLSANMTAGHVVIGIFLGLVVTLEFYLVWIPFGFSIGIYGLEIFISFIQAYIFTFLATLYIGQAIHLH